LWPWRTLPIWDRNPK
jgi:hypothetical protein